MTIESEVNFYIKRECQVAPQPSLGPLTVTVTGPVAPYRPAMAHTGPGRCELNARHSSRVSVCPGQTAQGQVQARQIFLILLTTQCDVAEI